MHSPRRHAAPSSANRLRAAVFEALESRRLLSTGDLDATFGDGGKIDINQSYYPEINVTDAALQADGKIVEVGELDLLGLAVVRLDADGAIDPTFTPPTKASDRRIAQFLDAVGVVGASVVIQPDGQILVGVEGGGNFYVLRFDAAGNLDHTFGKRGIAGVDFGATENLTDIALTPDGKIVAAGYTSVESTDPTNVTIHYYDNNVAVARLNGDGSVDRSFFDSGTVVSELHRSHVQAPSTLSVAGKGASVAVQPDGKVVVSASGPDADAFGDGRTNPDHSLLYVFRYNTDGTPDRSFADAGTFSTQVGDHGSFSGDLGLDAKSRITVAGASFQSDPNNPNVDTKTFTMLRLTARGRADRTFGDAGVVLGKADGLTGDHVAMVVHKNGTVVAAISERASVNETAAVYRFLSDGTPDTSFGDGGASPRFTGSPVAALPYRDGRTAVASYHAFSNIPENLLRAARVRADGSADTTFGDGTGEVQIGLPVHANDVLEDMAVRRSDGKVVVHGSLDYSSLPISGGTLKDLVVAYDDAGRAAIAFGPPAGFFAYGGPMALAPGDKVIVGDLSDGGTDNQLGSFGAHRYNADGSPDKPFGGGGAAATDQLFIDEDGYLYRLAAAPDGRVVGLASTHYGLSDDGDYVAPRTAELMYVSADGATVTRGKIGGATAGAVDEFSPIDLAFQSDGSLIVAGVRYTRPAVDADPTSAQIELRRSGTNLGGETTFKIPTSAGFSRFTSLRAIAIGKDDKIIVIGTTGRRASAKGRSIVLARFNADGTPDTTFNGTGALVTDLAGNVSNVVVQGDGKIVFAVNVPTGPVIVRYTADGSPDARLDGDGVLDAGLGDRANIQQLAFAPDGKLVAGGTIGTGRRGRAIDLLLARYDW